MKHLFLVFVSTFAMAAVATPASKEIKGTVTVAKSAQKKISANGVLFIFAKKAGHKAGDGGMPMAVVRMPSPHFPLHFELGPQNNMMSPGTPFKGKMTVFARFSPSGDAMDQSGPNGATKHPVKAGAHNVHIVLK